MFFDERWRLSWLNSNEHARGDLANTKPICRRDKLAARFGGSTNLNLLLGPF